MKIYDSTTTKRCLGFTLVELLVVIAILCLLAAILFPVFSRVRENGRRAACQSNLRQIGLAITQYTQDYDERMPPFLNKAVDGSDTPWHSLVQPYVKELNVFRCPSNGSAASALVYGSQNSITPRGVRRSYLANGGVETATVRGTAGARPWKDHRPLNPSVVSLASLGHPSTTISVVETKGINNSDAQAAWMSCFSEASRTFNDHLGTANFLFLDGHVKSLRPTATATSTINMWTIDNQTSLPSAAVGASALLQTNMRDAETVMPQNTAGACP